MTYGWAILVVLVVIGALAYFGVLNPSILLPEKCTLETGLSCRDHRIDSTIDNVDLMIENGKGKGIIITNVDITGELLSGCSKDYTTLPPSEFFNSKPGKHLPNGVAERFSIGCTDIAEWDGKTKGIMTIEWYFEDSTTDFMHTMKGEILAKVEK